MTIFEPTDFGRLVLDGAMFVPPCVCSAFSAEQAASIFIVFGVTYR